MRQGKLARLRRLTHGNTNTTTKTIASLVLVMCAAAALLSQPTPAAGQERYELSGGQWQQQSAPSPNSPEGQLQAIRHQLAQGHPKAAEQAADQWIKQYANHADQPEALLIRGDAKAARSHYWDALYDYEAIIRKYPASEQFHTALQREYEIARLYVNGMNRRFLGMRLLPAEGDGEELLIRIQERAPGSELGEIASLTLADYYYTQRKMASAAEAYDLFLGNYPESDKREWAMLRLIQANLARFKGPRFDSTGLIEAAQRLQTYREEFPAAADRIGADALLVRINQSLASKAFLTAEWYAQRKEWVSAAYLYGRVVQEYPQTTVAEKAMAKLKAIPESIKAGLSQQNDLPVRVTQTKAAHETNYRELARIA